MNELKNQQCPICKKKTLTLKEEETTVPHFGKLLLFSMTCSSCNYSSSDVEPLEKKEPAKYTITTDNEKDMNIKVVKSSTATVKIPQLKISVTPGPASIGYISNIEGLLDRFKAVIEDQRDNAEDKETRKKAKNLLKKIWKVKLGEVPLKIIIEDPNGNSAIISDKAKVEKLK